MREQQTIVNHFAALLKAANELRDLQAGTEVELNRLEQSILDRAFRGEL